MSEERIKVLYIGGYSRSGSTLLLRLLGQMEGYVGVGEVWDIWRRSFAENQLCGCNRPFKECEFWQAVVAEAFGDLHQVDAEAMQALRRSVQSNQHIPLLALPFLRPPNYKKRLQAYTEILSQLYRGIQRVSGGKIIVDSSKVPPYAFLLNQVKDIELHIVHLVRDSRATAFSWLRKRVRPEIYWKTAYMGEYSPLRSALEWDIMNGLLHSLKHSGASYQRIRYEELVEQPGQVVLQIAQALGQEAAEVEFFEGRQAVRLDVDHTVSGNPNRFQQGAVEIRPDIEWQEKMAGGQKRLVTALTLPLMLHYGYLGRPRPARKNGTANTEREGRGTLPGDGMKAGPLRILQVSARYLPYTGGTEIHTYEVARRLAAAGNQVTVLTANPGQRKKTEEQAEGVQIIRVPAWPDGRDYFFAPDIYKTIRRGDWDIVHCQGYHTLVAPLVMLAAWRAKIPYVVTFHSGGHSSRLRNALRPLQQALLRPLLARAAGLVGVSRWEAEFFRERLRLPKEQFSVIPNGSYLPRAQNPSASQSNRTLIVSVGRLERYKGHHRVIAALPLVAEQRPEVRLRIVGSGPYEADLRQLTVDLGVADRVEIKGVAGQDREGMAAILMEAKLAILLSNYESQGISVMEALSLGCPVLVADTTALGELAASGLARVTPLGSTPQWIAAAILGQLHQPLIPANAELPTWEACAGDIQNLYRRIIAGRPECAC